MTESETESLFEKLPVQLNLGSTDIIGWANAQREIESGKTVITIALDAESSQALHDLAAVFDLKAIGFAGIKRSPGKKTSNGPH